MKTSCGRTPKTGNEALFLNKRMHALTCILVTTFAAFIVCVINKSYPRCHAWVPRLETVLLLLLVLVLQGDRARATCCSQGTAVVVGNGCHVSPRYSNR